MSRREDAPDQTRRRVLASLGTGTVLSLSGCITTLPPLGQRVRFGRVAVPDPEPPAYRSWVPAESALPGGTPTAPLFAGRPGSLSSSRLGLGTLVSRPDWLGTAFEEYDLAVCFGQTHVFEGSTGRGVVAAALEGTGYASAGTHDGYDVYERSDGPRTVAAGDDAVIWTAGERGRSIAETVIDAHAGRVERRHEVDEPFEAITDAVGLTDFDVIAGLNIGLDATDVAQISGMSFLYRNDARYVRSHHLFETADDVSERRIRRELRATELVDAAAVDLHVEGRRAVIEARFDGTDEAWWIPQITWGVNHDPDEDVVTLRHEAGDAVDADDLAVSLGRRESADGDDGPTAPQFAAERDRVGPGDTLDVSVDWRTRSVNVAYRPTDGERTRLFSYELP